MNTYTVSFFGHRKIEDAFKIERRLEDIICMILNHYPYVEFLVGRDGEFDLIAASTVRRSKRKIRDDNSALVWVMPYTTAEFRNNEEVFRNYYDEIEISTSSEKKHFKAAHQARNRELVDRSDLVIFFVQTQSGGAWQTMEYAKKQGKDYINLAGCEEENAL